MEFFFYRDGCLFLGIKLESCSSAVAVISLHLYLCLITESFLKVPYFLLCFLLVGEVIANFCG
jgi:hypothetical protein